MRGLDNHLRLDPETEALLRRLAKAQGRSKSAVVREAVEHYGNRETRAGHEARTALDVVGPFIGVVDTNGQLSNDTHSIAATSAIQPVSRSLARSGILC